MMGCFERSKGGPPITKAVGTLPAAKGAWYPHMEGATIDNGGSYAWTMGTRVSMGVEGTSDGGGSGSKGRTGVAVQHAVNVQLPRTVRVGSVLGVYDATSGCATHPFLCCTIEGFHSGSAQLHEPLTFDGSTVLCCNISV